MESEKFTPIYLTLNDLSAAATEICKVKGMLGMLLKDMPKPVQEAYFQRIRDAGLDEELIWLESITSK